MVLPKIQKILIIRTDRIGELVLSLPVITALKGYYPGGSISLMAQRRFGEYLAGFSDIGEVIDWRYGLAGLNFLEKLRLARALRRKHFDLAIIMNPSRDLNQIVFLSGIPYRLGYDRKWAVLLNIKIPDLKFKGEKHEVEYNLDLLRAIGVEPKSKELPRPNIAKADRGEDKRLIAIHPLSSNPAKRWMRSYYAELARRLVNQGYQVSLIGDKNGYQYNQDLIAEAGVELDNLAGKFTLSELASFFTKCSLLISNDSGPVHIASSVKLPVIAIFGRNIPGVGPKRWGPYRTKSIVFHKDPGCNPCLDRDCRYEFKCLKAITPDEVYQAAVELIGA